MLETRSYPLHIIALLALLLGSARPALNAQPASSTVAIRPAPAQARGGAAASSFEPAVLVQDLYTGTLGISSGASGFVTLAGIVYFEASHPTFGSEL